MLTLPILDGSDVAMTIKLTMHVVAVAALSANKPAHGRTLYIPISKHDQILTSHADCCVEYFTDQEGILVHRS